MKNPKKPKTNAEKHMDSLESFDAALEQFFANFDGSKTLKSTLIIGLKARLDEQTLRCEVASKLGQAVTARFYEYWEACQKLQAELEEVRNELGVTRLMNSVISVIPNRN